MLYLIGLEEKKVIWSYTSNGFQTQMQNGLQRMILIDRNKKTLKVSFVNQSRVRQGNLANQDEKQFRKPLGSRIIETT